MWFCRFHIYIRGIKFPIWQHSWSCFRHSDKSSYCSLYMQFYKLFWLWFHVDFFLNLGFYHNTVNYRHQYFNEQYISTRKNPYFIVYTKASPEKPPSVTSGSRVSVQPAKPALPIRFLYKELPNVYVFSTHKVEYLISRFWLCLRSMCSVHLLTQTQGSLAFPVVWK